MEIFRATALALCVMLGGCATTSVFDPRACPTERTYTRAEQAALAKAIPRAPVVIQNALVDYGRLRDKVRACRGIPVP